jgi:hypothetical protein
MIEESLSLCLSFINLCGEGFSSLTFERNQSRAALVRGFKPSFARDSVILCNSVFAIHLFISYA